MGQVRNVQDIHHETMTGHGDNDLVVCPDVAEAPTPKNMTPVESYRVSGQRTTATCEVNAFIAAREPPKAAGEQQTPSLLVTVKPAISSTASYTERSRPTTRCSSDHQRARTAKGETSSTRGFNRSRHLRRRHTAFCTAPCRGKVSGYRWQAVRCGHPRMRSTQELIDKGSTERGHRGLGANRCDHGSITQQQDTYISQAPHFVSGNNGTVQHGFGSMWIRGTKD